MTTSGFPQATITKVGALPAGLTFIDNNDGTATITGTPAVGTDGSYPITITADNGTGTAATQSFVLKTGSLPDGLSFVDNNDGTATIKGTPAADTDGTYALSLTARNGSTAKKTYMVDVN